jgi:magnesium chelatase family protein
MQRQGCSNAALVGDALQTHAALRSDAALLLQRAADRLGWSGRSLHRVMKVARSLADLDASDGVEASHVGQALQYRRAQGT